VSGPPLFTLDRVTFGYPGGPDVLREVSLSLPMGRKLCIVGRNGTGKSTLLYLLGLLWEGGLRGGSIVLHLPNGSPCPYDRLTPPQRRGLRGGRFGFILQDAYLMPQLTCAENVAMPLLLAGQAREAALTAARQFIAEHGGGDLARVQDNPIDTLSGGQRQMMAVLRALIHKPDVVFADEPTKSLDEHFRPLVLGMLDEWHAQDRAKRTLLLVLHEPRDVAGRAEGLVYLGREGRVRENRVMDGMQASEEEIRGWIQQGN
jgi:putative ABC transport system ATP-binding protein